MKLMLVGIFLLRLLPFAVYAEDATIRLENWLICNNAVGDLADERTWDWMPGPEDESAEYIKFDNRSGIAWISADIVISGNADEISALYFPELFMADETYLNGQLIGSLPLEDFASFQHPRLYPIPDGLLKNRSRLLIKLEYAEDFGGSVSKEIQAVTENDYRNAELKSILLRFIYPFGIMFLLLGILLSFLIKYLFNRSDSDYLVLVFRILIASLSFLTVFTPVPVFRDMGKLSRFWLLLLTGYFFQMFLYLQAVNKRFFPGINKISAITLFIGGSMLMLLPGNSAEGNVASAVLTVIAAATVIVLYFWYLKNKIPSRSLLLHTGLDILFFIVLAFSVFYFSLGGESRLDPSQVQLIFTLGIAANLTVFYSRQERTRKKQLMELQNRFQEKSAGISPDLKEKLTALLEFIRQDPSQPLYRDDLAASVGLTPTYFSTLFNRFTGQKLTEYVNSLRLENASDLLHDTQKKIIDIAFTCGFESLSTFNRLFKIRFGKSPKEYRLAHHSQKT